ncbi:Cyclops-like protein [Thalictrum thalictroides]|uniref:Cyclops-like protein n=1 Tax=Thalictrum thalictroides TaxID=46969 RepID=A0A7J6VTU0_THATH|nr:Cyclops-like protein [Thalictrum thalictroides]
MPTIILFLHQHHQNNGHNSTNRAHRTRQPSRRLSTELAALTSQHHGVTFHNKSSNDFLLTQNLPMVDELSNKQNEHSLRNSMEKGMQATNLYLAKAWFHSSQPMTRSRSSELRRKYAAMQNFQTSIGVEATRDAAAREINAMKQPFATTSNFCDAAMVDNTNQLETFMSPSNSSTSPFNTPLPTVDAVSSVVSMLKGTLERKKLSNHIDKETVQGSSFEFYGSQEVPLNMSFSQGALNDNFEPSGIFQAVSTIEVKDSETLHTDNKPIEIDTDGLVAPANPMQISAVSREPSQSESSAAAPAHSTGYEVCDGPSISGQTPSVSESSRRQVRNGSLEYSSKAKEFRERILENNIKDDRKKGSLIRVGSVTSAGSVDKGDPTKKRRVERSRKMAEAKERNMTPAVSLDMQSTLKRCENLEKEVRSLKLNLSFMNRKDSEQTKQIEDLQKQNEELIDEKERLLEEIERIVSETGKM